MAIVESVTLRPIVRAWAVAADHTVLVAREAGESEVAEMDAAGRTYHRLAGLALPAHRIVVAADGRLWLRSWPAKLSERARTRPFGRELLVLRPSGALARVLTMEGAIIQIVVAGTLVLVATSGGAVHAYDPDGRHLWTHSVPGWAPTPEQRLWADAAGRRVWVSERRGVTELDSKGCSRWGWEGPAPIIGDAPTLWRRRQAAELLGVPDNAPPAAVRRAFRRLAKETHPDHHPEDPHAAPRFRAVVMAYRVLLQQDSPEPRQQLGSALLEVTGVWPAGAEGVWVATASGSWHLLDGRGREREDGCLRRRAPATLAVSLAGELVAAGGAGALELASGQLVLMPTGWDYRLRATSAGIVAHCREGMVVVGQDGAVEQTSLLRPADTEWVGDDLYLFCAEGDFWRLRSGSPAPPATPPSRRPG